MWSRREFLVRSAVVSVAAVSGSRSLPAPAPREAKRTPAEAQKAAESGLSYLVDRQKDDGSFGTGNYPGCVGITSLAALAFLAAGHRPDGSARGQVIRKALDFVLSQENRGGGHPGFLRNPNSSPHGPMYNHGLGTLFLAHLHRTGKEMAEKTDAVLDRAVKLIVSSQNKEGGWRYQPTSKDADSSVTFCQMNALAAARQAGVKVPKKTLDAGVKYLKDCFDPDSGGFRYMVLQGAAGNLAFARTAGAVAVLRMMGERGNEVEKGTAYLLRHRPEVARSAKPDMHYFYGHYFASIGLRLGGGETWEKWYAAISKELRERQGRDGNWTDQICPHYATAMACLVLLSPDGRLAEKNEPKRKE